jgi:hypothetical protein
MASRSAAGATLRKVHGATLLEKATSIGAINQRDPVSARQSRTAESTAVLCRFRGLQSARGQAHSKTWRTFLRFKGSILRVGIKFKRMEELPLWLMLQPWAPLVSDQTNGLNWNRLETLSPSR